MADHLLFLVTALVIGLSVLVGAFSPTTTTVPNTANGPTLLLPAWRR